MSFYKLLGIASFSFFVMLQGSLRADVTHEVKANQHYGPRVDFEEIRRIADEKRRRNEAEIEAKAESVERIFYATHSKEEFEAAMRGYESSDDKATFVNTLEKEQVPVKPEPPFYAAPVFKLLGFLGLFFFLGIFVFWRRKKPVAS